MTVKTADSNRVVVGEQLSVARFLADLVDRERGEEKANVMTVLMGVTDELGNEVKPIVGRLADTLRVFLNEQPLRPEHLSGALRIGVLASDPTLTERVFEAEDLLADPERLREAASLLDQLSDPFAARVRDAVVNAFPTDSTVLTEPLSTLPSSAAVELLDDDHVAGVSSAVREAIDADGEAGAGVASALAASVADRTSADRATSGLGGRVLWTLLLVQRDAAYGLARGKAEVLEAGDGPSQRRNSHTLKALAQAPPHDWTFWGPRFDPSLTRFDPQQGWSADALVNIFDRFREGTREIQEASTGVISALASFISDADTASDVVSAVGRALGGIDWWTDGDTRREQERLHAATRGLCGEEEPFLARVAEARVADIRRALAALPATPGEEVATALVTLAPTFDIATARQLAEEFQTAMAAGDEDQILWAIGARAEIARSLELRVESEESGPFYFSEDELREAAASSTRAGAFAIAQWLGLGPSQEAVLGVLRSLDGRAPKAVRDALATWAEDLDPQGRSDLIWSLIEGSEPADRLIDVLANEGIHEEEIIHKGSIEIQAESQGNRRSELVKHLVATHPQSGKGQRAIADLMIQLLSTGKRNDFDAALQASQALGTRHRSSERLRDALRDAADKHGFRIPREAAKHLAAAGVKPPKRTFRKGVFDAVKSRFR